MPADRRDADGGRLLEQFGVPERAERVWHAILCRPDASWSELAKTADIPHDVVDEVVGDLRAAHLVRDGDTALGVVATEPTLAVERLIARAQREMAYQTEQLAAVRSEVPLLAQIYASARAGRVDQPSYEIVDSLEDIRKLIFLAGECTRSEHRHLMREVSAKTIRSAMEADAQSLERGVHQRTIIGTPDLESPDVYLALKALHELGEEVRAAPYVPTQMMIMDRDLAVVSRAAVGSSLGAVFIREQNLIDVLIFMFDHMWSAAVPVFAEPEGLAGAPTGRTARVLELMAAGIKDGRVARMLGVTDRTVRREIADLKAALGVTSRTEIVAAAVRHGWL